MTTLEILNRHNEDLHDDTNAEQAPQAERDACPICNPCRAVACVLATGHTGRHQNAQGSTWQNRLRERPR